MNLSPNVIAAGLITIWSAVVSLVLGLIWVLFGISSEAFPTVWQIAALAWNFAFIQLIYKELKEIVDAILDTKIHQPL